MPVKRVAHPSAAERIAKGRQARTVDPITIATYLGGTGEEFDKSITDFSERYADQNEKDYQQFADAVRSGRLEAREGV